MQQFTDRKIVYETTKMHRIFDGNDKQKKCWI